MYGYKSGADYYIRLVDLTGPRVRTYHVVNGVRTSLANNGADAVTPGVNFVRQFGTTRREQRYYGPLAFGSAGLPSGRVGFFTTIAGASCSQLTFEDDSESRDTAGRWQGWVSPDESNGINTYRGVIPSTGRLEATFGYSNKGWLADNLRLQRFQAVFRVSRDGEFNTALDVLFNANDPDDADAVTGAVRAATVGEVTNRCRAATKPFQDGSRLAPLRRREQDHPPAGRLAFDK